MATKAWGTEGEATAILSENAGRAISRAYVRQLVRLGHVRARKLDGRTNQYHLGDCRGYSIRQNQYSKEGKKDDHNQTAHESI